MPEESASRSHSIAGSGSGLAETRPREAEDLLSQLARAFATLRPLDGDHLSSLPETETPAGVAARPGVSETYRTLVEQIPAILFLAYIDGGIGQAYVSPQIGEKLGFSPEEWLEDPIRWYQQIHPDDKQRWSLEAAEALVSGQPLRSAYRMLARDGKTVWFRCEVKMVRHVDGRPWYMQGVAFDVTDLKETEESLRESEERFRLIVESVQDYAIFMLDATGRVATWNVGAERIKGYRASEIIGRHFSCFYPEGDVRSGKPAWELDTAAKVGRIEDEGWRLRKDGSTFWANVIITALRNNKGTLVGFSKITRDFTERMRAKNSLEESQQKVRESERSLRELSLHLLRTQDEERRLIGREMHDSLGQYLSVLKMKLDALAGSDGTGGASAEQRAVSECIKLVDECVKEVRTVSYLLYPPMLEEMGLKSAIPWYLEGFSKRSGIRTSLEIAEDFERVSRDAELVLFRVLQESLTNVHKHSASPAASIRLMRTGDAVVLEVIDQGKGLPDGILEQSGPDWMGSLGVGLRGMSERILQLGGTLDVSSNGAGTQVRATVPARESAVPDTPLP
jgi:PAS domain S-box-containing protein